MTTTIWRPNPAGPRVIWAVLRAGTAVNPAPPPTGHRAVAAIRLLCAEYHVGVVVVDPAAQCGPVIAQLMHRALRAPPLTVGQMDVWLNVQADLHRP